MTLEDLKDKKILILGLGKEGLSTLSFLRKKYPKQTIGVADQNDQQDLPKDDKLELHFGKDYLKAIDKYDVVFKSPGINLKDQSSKITSQAEIFLEFKGDKIIGVTGTKGKSTTSSLIYKILKDANFKVELVGNIGKAPFDYLDEKYKDYFFVYEFSSFQLQNVKTSPHIAVLLNIYHEHLDYHGNFETYKKAKENITKYQNKKDYLIFNSDSKEVVEIAQRSKAIKIPFSESEKETVIFETDLKGKFNLNNIKAAVKVAKIFKVGNEKITESVKLFKPLKHRLQFVGMHKGIEFYNDSIATIPQATIAALNALSPNVNTLVVGGLDRGLDFSQLAKKIVEEKIENLIIFPQTGKKILDKIGGENYAINQYFVSDMAKAIKIAASVTRKGKICLLSPAAASYNLFRNFEDRGQQFIDEVNKL